MTNSYEELLNIAAELEQLAARGHSEEIWQPLERLDGAAEEVGKAWSGSLAGYHANTYYRDFNSPPMDMYFSREWGLPRSAGNWVTYIEDRVFLEIRKRAGMPNVTPAYAFNDEVSRIFSSQQQNLLSIIEIELGNSNSPFLSRMKERVNELSVITAGILVDQWTPKPQSTERGHVRGLLKKQEGAPLNLG